MDAKAPAKSTDLTREQVRLLLNTLQTHDEHGETYMITPLNWVFVDLDQNLDDISIDDYENDEDVMAAEARIPEDVQDIPVDAFDSLYDGFKAAVISNKLMVLYFEDDDYVEIDPETASELVDSGPEAIDELKTKDQILDYIESIVGL